MSSFDWLALLRGGLAHGIAPRVFWSLTPAELAFLLGKSGGSAALTRAQLEDLAAAYPDRPREDDNDRQDRE